MKKELSTHLLFSLSFVVFVSVFHKWIGLPYIAIFLGALVGTILPDMDHFIYTYFINPQDLTSQRVDYHLKKKEISNTFNLLTQTRYERKNLIFHSVYFQIIFLILTFFVMTSSGSMFAKGIVLAFSIHLIADQMMDFIEVDNINLWFEKVNLKLDKEKQVIYWVANIILLMIIAFVL